MPKVTRQPAKGDMEKPTDGDRQPTANPPAEMGPLVKRRWSEVKDCTKVELDSDYGYDVDEFQNQD